MVTFAAGFPKLGDNVDVSEGQGDDLPSVEAVGFSQALPVAVTGSLSGVVGVWDISTQKLRQKFTHEVDCHHSIVRILDVWGERLEMYMSHRIKQGQYSN